MKNKKLSKFSKERVLELVIEGRKIIEDREKETRNDITKQQIKGLQDKIGGTLKEIRRVITGKKEIGNILEGYTKSDISRAEKARLRYRTDNGNLDRVAEESTRVKERMMKNSKERLDALSKEFRRRSEERKKSGKSSEGIPSLTLAEQRKLGLINETTMVVSFGKKKK